MRRPTAAIFKLRQKAKEHLSEDDLLNIYKYIDHLELKNRRLETKVNCLNLWEKWNGGNKGKTV